MSRITWKDEAEGVESAEVRSKMVGSMVAAKRGNNIFGHGLDPDSPRLCSMRMEYSPNAPFTIHDPENKYTDDPPLGLKSQEATNR